MPQTYPLPLPTLKVLISSTDRTAEVLARTLHVHAVLAGQNNTCTFEMKSPESWRGTATNKPTVGQTVEVQIQTGSGPFDIVFGGTISRVQEVRMAYKTVKWAIECRDYTSLLQVALVNKRYNNWQVDNIVKDIVAIYVPSVIVNNNVQSATTVIDTITFAYQYPKDCLDKLAQAVGYQWYIDSSKVLHFYLPGPTTKPSPNTITDTSNNFNNLSIEPQLDQVRNRIYVRGGNAYLSLREEFTNDGTETYRVYQLGSKPVTMVISSGGTGAYYTTPAMTVNGEQQFVGLQGTTDQSIFQDPEHKAWMLDANGGTLYAIDTTETPPDGSTTVVTYSAPVPIGVMRENTSSQRAVAVLESGTYSNVVLADSPTHWWRLGDVGGTSAFNSAPGPATDQTRYGGTYLGSTERPNEGALNADLQGSTAFTGGWMQTLSGSVWPQPSYTVEAWVKNAGGTGVYTHDGVIVHNTDASGHGQRLEIYFGQYRLTQTDGAGGAAFVREYNGPTGAGWDHVVATYDTTVGSGYLWVNNTLAGSSNFGAGATLVRGPTTVVGSGGITAVQEVALYNYVLSGSRIAAHYNAGRYAGVREYLLTDNQLSSFDDARKTADLQLSQYANVITYVTFDSYVSGWKVGDAVSTSLTWTTSGLNRSLYTGDPIIQEIDFNWLGAQRVLYQVQCIETRFNWIDYQRTLAKARDVIPGQRAFLDYIKTRTEQFLMIDGGPIAVTVTPPPYVVQPDYGASLLPILYCGLGYLPDNIW